MTVPGKEFKKKDKRDKQGVELQAKTVAQAMIGHWLTVFDVPAVICSDSGTQFVGEWFRTMCKYIGVRHAQTVAYHSRSNQRAEVASRHLFKKFRQLHIEEPGTNWYHSLWRVLQAYHDLAGPSGLFPHRIFFLQDRVSRTLPWMNHGNVAKEANAMRPEADDTAKKGCDAVLAEHAKRAEYFESGEFHKYRLKDTVWVGRHHKDVLSRHRLQSWYIPGVILRKTGQDVYVIQVGCSRGNWIPMAVLSPFSSPRTPSTLTTTERRTSTAPSASSQTSLIPAHRADGYTRSDDRFLLHRGTRGNLGAALCRSKRPCGWTTSKPRKSSWMSRMCWFTWSWATEIDATASYAYF